MLEKKAYSVAEVAEIIGISRAHAYELCNQEDFPAIHPIPGGKRIIVPVKAFDEWLKRELLEEKGIIMNINEEEPRHGVAL